jgi:hypothetical protein
VQCDCASALNCNAGFFLAPPNSFSNNYQAKCHSSTSVTKPPT